MCDVCTCFSRNSCRKQSFMSFMSFTPLVDGPRFGGEPQASFAQNLETRGFHHRHLRRSLPPCILPTTGAPTRGPKTKSQNPQKIPGEEGHGFTRRGAPMGGPGWVSLPTS